MLGTVCQGILTQIWQLMQLMQPSDLFNVISSIAGMSASTLKRLCSDLVAHYNPVGAVHYTCSLHLTDYYEQINELLQTIYHVPVK